MVKAISVPVNNIHLNTHVHHAVICVAIHLFVFMSHLHIERSMPVELWLCTIQDRVGNPITCKQSWRQWTKSSLQERMLESLVSVNTKMATPLTQTHTPVYVSFSLPAQALFSVY